MTNWKTLKVGDRIFNKLSGLGTVTHMDLIELDFCVKYDKQEDEVSEDIHSVVKAQKLVWEYYKTDGISYGYDITIPFEYSSKDDFCLAVLEKCDAARKSGGMFPTVMLFEQLDDHIAVEDLDDIEKQVFTLEEWFEYKKLKNPL